MLQQKVGLDRYQEQDTQYRVLLSLANTAVFIVQQIYNILHTELAMP